MTTDESELQAWDRYFAPTITMLSKESARYTCPITDTRPVASYNWADSRLVVPGAPAEVHLNYRAGLQLKRDIQATASTHEDYIEHSQYPLEPLFRSLLIHNPRFRFDEVDLVSDYANLRDLYGFMRGTADRDFSFEVVRVGELVLFQQIIPITTTNTAISDSATCGHATGYQQDFVQRYAFKERQYSEGQHHRVVKCKLGGLHLLVRSPNTAVLHRPAYTKKQTRHPNVHTREVHRTPGFANLHTYTGVKPLRPRLLDTTEGLDTSFSDLTLGALMEDTHKETAFDDRQEHVDGTHTTSVVTRLALTDLRESDAYVEDSTDTIYKLTCKDTSVKADSKSKRLNGPTREAHIAESKIRLKAMGTKHEAHADVCSIASELSQKGGPEKQWGLAPCTHSPHSRRYGSRLGSIPTTESTTGSSTGGLDLEISDASQQECVACSEEVHGGCSELNYTTTTHSAVHELAVNEDTTLQTHAQPKRNTSPAQTQSTHWDSPPPIPQKLPTPIVKVVSESLRLPERVTPLHHTTREQLQSNPTTTTDTVSAGTATELTKRDRPRDGSTTAHSTHTRAPESQLDVVMGGDLRLDDLCVQLKAVSSVTAHEFDYEREYLHMLLTGTQALLRGVHTRDSMAGPPELMSLQDCERLCTSSTTLRLNRFAILMNDVKKLALLQEDGVRWTLQYIHSTGKLLASKQAACSTIARTVLPQELLNRIKR